MMNSNTKALFWILSSFKIYIFPYYHPETSFYIYLIKNIGKAHIGLSPSEETREKIGKKLKGRIPWNKGKKLLAN